MNKKKYLLFTLLSVLIISLPVYKKIVASTYTSPALPKRVITNYWPVRGGDSMQGGIASATKGLDGQMMVRTLEDVRTGKSTYVTIAGTQESYGAKYRIPEITYINAKGETHTLKNVQAYVNDTGGYFRVDKARSLTKKDLITGIDPATGKRGLEVPGSLRNKYPDGMTKEENAALRSIKRDIAVDVVDSTNQIKSQPASFVNVQLIPENDKAREADNFSEELKQKAGLEATPETNFQPQTTQSPIKTISQIINPLRTYLTSSGGGGMLWDSRDRYCHKHTGPASPKELKTAQTCNAGFKCFNYACGKNVCHSSYFVKDCGPNNAYCDSAAFVAGNGYCQPKESNPQDGPSAGCLNYKCKNKPNAIWDMGSKKCGCG